MGPWLDFLFLFFVCFFPQEFLKECFIFKMENDYWSSSEKTHQEFLPYHLNEKLHVEAIFSEFFSFHC